VIEKMPADSETENDSLSTDKSPLFVHLQRPKVMNNYPYVGEPMGYIKDVEVPLEEDESCAFVMVPDKRQRNPVEKATQGSMLVLLNLTLTLFGFNSDSMFAKKKCQQKPNA
jgi:hypothetical protein